MDCEKYSCFCVRCSVKKQCKLYTNRNEGMCTKNTISTCTNQKYFVQDKDEVVKGR